MSVNWSLEALEPLQYNQGNLDFAIGGLVADPEPEWRKDSWSQMRVGSWKAKVHCLHLSLLVVFVVYYNYLS